MINQIKPSLLVLGNEYKDIKSFQSELVVSMIMAEKLSFMLEKFTRICGFVSSNTDGFENKRRQEFIEACRRQSLTKIGLLSCIDEWKE